MDMLLCIAVIYSKRIKLTFNIVI